jgi:hypothetical protein
MLQKFDGPSLDWIGAEVAARAAGALEQGQVLLFPELVFPLGNRECRIIAAGNAAGDAKNISFDPRTATLKGTGLDDQQSNDLAALMTRFGDFAEALIRTIAPHYGAGLSRMRTSFRPVEIAGREYSWRKDDRRRHVDAFPSSPTQGDRILRVFANVDQNGTPRIWRIGPDFEAYARAFLPNISTRQWPGLTGLMALTGITKSRRSRYDEIMLELHDAAKHDLRWQTTTPAEEVHFLPGQVWATFTDQVPHSVISGRNALEQTFIVARQVLQMPERSPAAILSRLSGVELTPSTG